MPKPWRDLYDALPAERKAKIDALYAELVEGYGGMTERWDSECGRVTLYCGDALEILRDPELVQQVDVCLTDPPFFCPATHYQSRVGWQRKYSDVSILQHWWSSLAKEISSWQKPTGHTLVFCNADSYPPFYAGMYSYWEKMVALVWDKDRPGLGRVWRHQHEFIIAARNSHAFEANDGVLRRDVLRHKATLSRDREHPVEKPESLLTELIEATCPVDGIVFDPFMGSGTTGSSAVKANRRFVGIELEPSYFEISKARIQDSLTPKQQELINA